MQDLIKTDSKKAITYNKIKQVLKAANRKLDEAEKLRSYYETKLQEVEKLLYDAKLINQEQIAKAESEIKQAVIVQDDLFNLSERQRELLQ